MAEAMEAQDNQNPQGAPGTVQGPTQDQNQNQNQEVFEQMDVTDVTSNIEPIANSLDQTVFENYYKDGKTTLYDQLKSANQNPYPEVIHIDPSGNQTNSKPERRSYGGENKSGRHWQNLEAQLSQWGAYYLEETRKMIASSEARSNKNTARMLFATNAQVEKLESVIARSVAQADINHKAAVELLEIVRTISSANNEKCDNGFRNLLPTEDSALAVSIDGINKHIEHQVTVLEARIGMARREENSMNKDEIKNSIRNNLRGAQRRNTLNSQSGHLRPSISEAPSDSRGPSPARSQTRDTPPTGPNGPVFHSQPEKTLSKIPNVNEETGVISFTWADLAGAKTNKPRGSSSGNGNANSNRGNSRNNNKSNNTENPASQNTPKNPDHQLRDAEKAAKTATNKANAESKASREFIVMRLPSNGKIDKIGEFKTFEKVIHEVSTNSLGSQGYDFIKTELKEIQLKRILKYGGPGYTGIYPLKVECPTKEVRDKFMECAERGGFLDKRTQVDIGYYQKSIMSEDDFNKNAPKFYLAESTTFAQRKQKREKAQAKEDLKNSEVHQNYLAWKKLDQQTTYRYTDEEYDELYEKLYHPIDERNANNAARQADQNAANIALAASTTNTTNANSVKNAARAATPPTTHNHNTKATTETIDRETDNGMALDDDDDDTPPPPKTTQVISVDDLICLTATSATGDDVFAIPNHMQTNQLNLNTGKYPEDPLRFKSQWGKEVSLLASNTPPGSPISNSHPPGVQTKSPPNQTRSANECAEVSKILSEITSLNTDILALIKEDQVDEAQQLALKQEILRITLEKKYNHKSPPHQHFQKNVRIQVPTTHNDGPARKRLDSGKRTNSNKRSWSQDARSPVLKPKTRYSQPEKQTPSSPESSGNKLNKSDSSLNHISEEAQA